MIMIIIMIIVIMIIVIMIIIVIINNKMTGSVPINVQFSPMPKLIPSVPTKDDGDVKSYKIST